MFSSNPVLNGTALFSIAFTSGTHLRGGNPYFWRVELVSSSLEEKYAVNILESFKTFLVHLEMLLIETNINKLGLALRRNMQ